MNMRKEKAPAAQTAEQSTAANKVMTDQEKADAKALMDFHGHPEKMSFGQLTDIDDL